MPFFGVGHGVTRPGGSPHHPPPKKFECREGWLKKIIACGGPAGGHLSLILSSLVLHYPLSSSPLSLPTITPLSPSLPPLCTAAGGARACGHGGAEHVRGWDAGGAGEGVHEGVEPYVDAH